ncbi:hypothetical protein JNUCC0626_20050 [Lentzea sp. JNUCC 0626]|uniref:hypothetical protein n=1 Tax=Lentzea sp. JNUCC 0626 TaxID=3367513 RepID=UPI003748FBD1
MMLAPATHPDSEAMLIGWLADRLTGVRVVADLPTDLEDVLPVVQVTGVSGATGNRGWNGHRWLTSSPRFDLDAYASTRADASDLCRTVQAWLAMLPGSTVGGAVVAQVTEELGPDRRPDYNTRVSRYGATYALLIRPA